MDNDSWHRQDRVARPLRRAFHIMLPAIVSALIATPAHALAEPAQHRFQVSPVKLEIAAKPGETQTRTVQLVNNGTENIIIDVETKDYRQRADSSFVLASPGHESFSPATWVSVEETALVLAPGEVRDCTITVRVPLNVESGGHYACTLFSVNGSQPYTTGLKIDGRIGATLLITVDGGPIRRMGMLKAFDIRTSLFSRQVDAEALFQNVGNVHVTTIQDVTFKNVFGREVGVASCDPITVLPGARRFLGATWTGPYFGRFTATARVRYGPDMTTYDRQKVSREVAFWIISPEAVLLAVAILALAGSLLALDIRELRRSRASDNEQVQNDDKG